MDIIWYVALAVVVVAMIVGDVRHREISNVLVLVFSGLAIVAMLFELPEGGGGGSVPLALGAGLAAFVVGLVVYGQGLLGGGDVKLAFGVVAVETWFGTDAWFIYLGVLIVAGIGTAIWLLRAEDGARAKGIPMAPTLLAGVVPSVVGVALLV